MSLMDYWGTSTSSTSSSSTTFYRTYYKEKMRFIEPNVVAKMKPKDLNFKGLSSKEVKKAKPPQTVFHFDPKGIVI